MNITSSEGVNTAAAAAATAARIPTKTLRQEDFLKLLVAQTRQQDPFNAGGMADMMDQMMSLGNFQAMQDVANRVETSAGLTASQFARALLGTEVDVADGEGGVASGPITATRLDGASVFVEVGGREYAAASILHFKSTNPDRT